MSQTYNILVLENDQKRVDWLENNSILSPTSRLLKLLNNDAKKMKFNIVHKEHVNDFLDAFQARNGKWDLLIFDCDLEPDPSQYEFDDDTGLWKLPDRNMQDDFLFYLDRDKDGLNGEDAASMLTRLKNVNTSVPVLVWSANPSGAKNIMRILAKGGFYQLKKVQYNNFNYSNLNNALIDLLNLDINQ